MQLTVKEVAEVLGARLDEDAANKRVLTGITWDSRKVKQNDIFLAMPGERVDGNDFIIQAIGMGAGLIICTKQPSANTMAIAGEFVCPVIVVESGITAITKLATHWRSCLRCVVVGVTGSTGKTSTKDLLYSVLSTRYNTVATQGNNNNELGIPYTVLRANPDTEILIVEMGMRGLGQIEHGCSIASPSIGVVTNVGVCHMELLGSREAIASAKGEMLAALPATGLAVVNGDDDMTEYMLEQAQVAEHGVHVTRFGRGDNCKTQVHNLTINAEGCASFDMALSAGVPFYVDLNVPGEHNVMNALAAAVVGSYMGLTYEQIAKGLAAAGASGMRMEVDKLASGLTVINDAYNANPDSMRAALATLGSMECEGKRIAVLGDMGELGDDEASLHEQVGRDAASGKLDYLLCVGPLSEHIAKGAQEAHIACPVEHVPDVSNAAARLKELSEPGDLILLKASRFMGLEKIIKEISD